MGGIICSCAGHVANRHDYSDDEDSLNWHMGNLGVCQFEAHFVPGRTLGTGSYGRVRCVYQPLLSFALSAALYISVMAHRQNLCVCRAMCLYRTGLRSLKRMDISTL